MTKTALRQLVELEQKTSAELREIHNQILPKKCAANACKEFLRPRIAYRLQELLYGGLSDDNKTTLLKIADSSVNEAYSSHTDLLPGTKICREWNGVSYEIEVLKDCYEFDGKKYKSLSAIAKIITGTKWNGLKFFRLKI